jgi:hypothetical protein
MPPTVRATSVATLVASCVAFAPAARAQHAAAEAPRSWTFLTARFDTRSAGSVYAGFGRGAAFAMGGVAHNARTGSVEVIGGVGAVIRTGARARHWVALATARADGASVAQLYWLPVVRAPRVTMRAQVRWTTAIHGRAPQKLVVAPLSVTMLPTRRFAVGGALDMSATAGARTSLSIGPELRLRLSGAVVGAHALRDLKGRDARVRLYFTSGS